MPPDGGDLGELQAIVITPGNRLVVLGSLSPPQRALVKAALLRRLAGTGSDDSGMAFAALFAVLAGSALLVMAARRRDAGLAHDIRADRRGG